MRRQAAPEGKTPTGRGPAVHVGQGREKGRGGGRPEGRRRRREWTSTRGRCDELGIRIEENRGRIGWTAEAVLLREYGVIHL